MQERNTHQKNLILQIMSGNKTHPTADEVYVMAREKEPRISRGTVYRNLNQLAECGKILKVSVPFGPDHFDSTLEGHYHFYCSRCGRVYDVSASYIEEFDSTPCNMQDSGFVVEGHNLIFTGRCPDCKNK